MRKNQKVILALQTLKQAGVTITADRATLEGTVAEAYDLLANEGLFKSVLNIEMIIAMNALYRPGPIDEIPVFIKNRTAGKWDYITPELAPILDVTCGVLVYQEQVMQIVRDLAGYTWGRSDLVRRAMSKKHEDEIQAERKNFVYGNKELNIPGCIAKGISEEAAHQIYDKMISFAKYAFNKSHAAAYSVVAFKTAWFKCYYPEEYFSAVMKYTEDIEKLSEIIADAKDFGIQMLPPSINESILGYKPLNGKIIFSLNGVKGVGEGVSEIIIREREANGPYTSFKDFVIRTRLKSKAIANLVAAGAFDCLGYTRNSLDITIPYIKEILDVVSEISKCERVISGGEKVKQFVEEYDSVEDLKTRIKEEGFAYQITSKKVPTVSSIDKKILNQKNKIASYLTELEEIDIEEIDEDIDVKLAQEKEMLGLYLTGHPTDNYIIDTEPISDVVKGYTAISGVVENLVVRKNRYGKEWASFDLSDMTGAVKVTMFSEYSKYKDIVIEGAALKLEGNVKRDDFNSVITIDENGVEIVEEEALQLIATGVKKLQRKSDVYSLEIADLSVWAEKFEAIMREFADESGARLRVIDKMQGLAYYADFRVNKDALQYAKRIA